jgi:hypothetical protein
MWTAIVKKFKTIEDNLLHNGKYVDRFDAMSLASVEIKDRSDETGLPHFFVPTTQLKGLTKLLADITAVLHEAYIEQQGALIVLKSGLYKGGNPSYPRDQKSVGTSIHNSKAGDKNESSSSSSHFSEMEASDWDPNVTSGEVPSLPDLLTEADKRNFRLSMQEHHNSLITILDAKLIANDVIVSSMKTYLRCIVNLANENCVLDSMQRANSLVQPQLTALLSHKFLETKEVRLGHTAF